MLTVLLLPCAPAKAGCAADALGTSRVLTVDPATTPRVGRKHFPATLALDAREVVLTFNDGPWPGTTPKVLDALRRECVQATFFVLGRNAVAHPDILRRELSEGHTVAHHTWSHPLLNRMSTGAAQAEIDRGIASVEGVLYGKHEARPVTPFFRFPGFASSPTLLEALARRGIVVFGADLWASDWNAMSPDAAPPGTAPSRAGPRRHRSIPRHQAPDRGHAPGVPAGAKSPGIPSGSYRADEICRQGGRSG
jgi:peptidoglycan/xylan/chitin deacetylase (PgdA/CDA1 family)